MGDYQRDRIKPLWRLPLESQSWPSAVTFVGSSRRVVAGNQDGLLVAWELPEETLQPVKRFEPDGKEYEGFEPPLPIAQLVGHTNGITRLVAPRDGRVLVSASLDHTLRIWDGAKIGDAARSAASNAAAGAAEAAGPVSQLVVDQKQRKYRALKLEEKLRAEVLEAPGVTLAAIEAAAKLEAHHDWVNALGISADGRRLISGDDGRQAIVWDLDGRREIARWTCPGMAWIASAALSADGQLAAVAQYRRRVGGDYNNYPAGLRIYRVADGEHPAAEVEQLDVLGTLYPQEKNPPYQYQYAYHQFVAEGLPALAFSADGRLLAVGQGGEGGDGKIHFVETATGKVLRTTAGHKYGVTDLCFTADGKFLFSAGRDTRFRITRTEDGGEAAVIGQERGGQFTDWLAAIALSPDERRLAAADIAGFIQIWDLG